jgi:hypothetical protein
MLRRGDSARRGGTTTLLAALNVLDGTVVGCCMPRHRHQEFLRFLNVVEAYEAAFTRAKDALLRAYLDNLRCAGMPE